MLNKLKSLTLAAIFMVSAGANASLQTDVQEMSDQFAKCDAAWYTAYTISGEKEPYFKQMSNGANVAAWGVLMLSGKSKTTSIEMANLRMGGELELYFADINKMGKLNFMKEVLTTDIEFCKRIAPIQKDIINELKSEIK